MDRLYSKKANALKAIFCALLGLLFLAVNALVEINVSFINVVVPVIIVACVYTVPFWFTLAYIKKYRVAGLGKAILYDFLFCFLPAFGGVLAVEAASVLINGNGVSDGFITGVFAVVFALISGVFWLMYKLLKS